MNRMPVLLLVIAGITTSQVLGYSGGSGTPEDPYQIATGEDLMALGRMESDYDKCFVLTADIDLTGQTLDEAVIAPGSVRMGGARDGTPSVFDGVFFNGQFNGDNHKIANLTIRGETSLGLFGALGSGATVANLGLERVDIKATSSYANGGLAALNYGRVSNSYITGTVCGEWYVGGLVGNNYGSIVSSHNACTVEGNDYVGGLVGNNFATISLSCSTGPVAGEDFIGGLVGHNSNGSISSTYSTGGVNGYRMVGGLVGDYERGSISSSYSSGLVNGDAMVGGLVGHSLHIASGGGHVSASFWDLETSGQPNSDGGVGLATAEMKSINTYLDAGWDFVGETVNGVEDIWKISEGLDYPYLSWQKYSGGCGVAEAPYKISNAADLILLGQSDEDYRKSFILIDNINLDPNQPGCGIFNRAVIAPDTDDVAGGFQGPGFSGCFDGQGYEISNYTLWGVSVLGLFGEIGTDGKVEHVDVTNASVRGTGGAIGTIAGINRGSVLGCHVSATVTAYGCQIVGGLVGCNDRSGLVVCSSSSGYVVGEHSVGGLVGSNYSSVLHCFSDSDVRGTFAYTGGLIGNNYEGMVLGSYSTGTVDGSQAVGGLVGGNREGAMVLACYSTGTVHSRYGGGLIGDNLSSYAINCFCTGPVDDGHNSGALVSRNIDKGMIINCFWNTETSGLSRSAGGVGLTIAEMQNVTTYLDAGWDFTDEASNGLHDLWLLPEHSGYPVLSRFHGYEPPDLVGQGVLGAPYLLSNARELGAMIDCGLKASYQLSNDIDMSDVSWSKPVIPMLHGNLDGNHHAIMNLCVAVQGDAHASGKWGSWTSSSGFLGLVGTIKSAGQIMDLEVGEANISGPGGNGVGILTGSNQGTIINCHTSGKVSGEQRAGGLVGNNTFTGRVLNCSSNSIVDGTDDIGGLVGDNDFMGWIQSCCSQGTIRGEMKIGGLVGESAGTIMDSYSLADVSGDQSVGGFVGLLAGQGVIANSYSGGAIVRGWSHTGGFIGQNSAANQPENVANSFWDTVTSGSSTSAGGTGKATPDMHTASTFLDVGWDFVDEMDNGTDDTWWILEGLDYPRLWWESGLTGIY